MNKQITLFILFIVVATTAMAQHGVVVARGLTNLRDSVLFARRIDSLISRLDALQLHGNGNIDLSLYYRRSQVDSLLNAKSIDLIIDDSTLKGSGTDADPLRVNPSFAGSGFTGVTVNTGKQVQFYENADGSISIQIVGSAVANAMKSTEGETLKTTEGETIIFN